MLSYSADAFPDGAYVRRLVQAAIGRRAAVGGGSPLLEAYRGVRLVHGESDGLPGVVVDSYDGWCVVQCASAGAEHFRGDIVSALTEAGAKGVFNRSDVDSRKREGLSQEDTFGVLSGEEPPGLIEIREGKIRYLVDVRKGHKTGFYLDQREARAQVGEHACGRETLNCFSYTGGFGLACAAGGAKSVVNLDLSNSALQLAERNFELLFESGVPECPVEFCCADVFKQLRLYRDQGRRFGLIVLDPPKFADTKAQLLKAARGYKDINLLAMKLLEPGGILASFSCSGAMTPEFFDTICREAACDAKRDIQIIGRTRQAADHPTALSFPEGEYLNGLLLRA
jgi:23S rRNA (cytosine1962-C5)-methyltransferase